MGSSNSTPITEIGGRLYWTGERITSLGENQIFIFGSNPEGRHGAGAAKKALQFGATYGKGRGLSGNTYALVTKNLTRGYIEPSTGIKYRKYGGVSCSMLTDNIKELYDCAEQYPDKNFLIPYKVDDTNLNGYSTEVLLILFKKHKIPSNIVFHESVRGLLWNV